MQDDDEAEAGRYVPLVEVAWPGVMNGGISGGSRYIEMHRRSKQVGDADGMVERPEFGDVIGEGDVVESDGVE